MKRRKIDERKPSHAYLEKKDVGNLDIKEANILNIRVIQQLKAKNKKYIYYKNKI